MATSKLARYLSTDCEATPHVGTRRGFQHADMLDWNMDGLPSVDFRDGDHVYNQAQRDAYNGECQRRILAELTPDERVLWRQFIGLFNNLSTDLVGFYLVDSRVMMTFSLYLDGARNLVGQYKEAFSPLG